MSRFATRRRRFAWGFCTGSLLAAGAVSGCISRGDVELLEANLRQQQDLASGYQRQLADLQNELKVAQSEAEQLRTQLTEAGSSAPQEHTEPLARITGIQFNSMMTGGRDQDGKPGHDVLTAVLTPHDSGGDMVKLSGTIQIELLDMSRSGEEQRIGSWTYPADKSRDLWHSGFLASGYQFDLPLESHPQKGNAVLHGRLTTSDGRQFDTTCPITLATASPKSPATLLASEARPVTSRPRKKTSSDRVRPVSSSSGKNATDVKQADFSQLEGGDALSKKPGEPSRPVPTPPDDDITSRPFPAESGVAKPFPEENIEVKKRKPRSSPVVTSDNWTDETIPAYR